MVDATGRALCALLGLAEDSADVAIAPSGTDVELLTVMLSLDDFLYLSDKAVRPVVIARALNARSQQSGSNLDTLKKEEG